MTARYIVGTVHDALATLPDGSVDLILSSPPFLALRSYLPSGHSDKAKEAAVTCDRCGAPLVDDDGASWPYCPACRRCPDCGSTHPAEGVLA